MRGAVIKSISIGEHSIDLSRCDADHDGRFIRTLTETNFFKLIRTTYGWNEEHYRREPAEPDQYTMIRRGGANIGFLTLRHQTDCLYLRSIQLVPEARGVGIGTSLMQHVENVAQANGHRTIRLRVFHKNRAVSLYRRLGYTVESSDEHSAGLRKAVDFSSTAAG